MTEPFGASATPPTGALCQAFCNDRGRRPARRERGYRISPITVRSRSSHGRSSRARARCWRLAAALQQRERYRSGRHKSRHRAHIAALVDRRECNGPGLPQGRHSRTRGWAGPVRRGNRWRWRRHARSIVRCRWMGPTCRTPPGLPPRSGTRATHLVAVMRGKPSKSWIAPCRAEAFRGTLRRV